MSSTVEQIKERLTIKEIVEGYLKLQKAGVNFKALCPFHTEKTPSFFISPARNSYYCFGCGAKGDIFSFVEKMEGVDFKDALRELGERAGVPLVRENKEEREKRERLFEAMEEAAAYFEEQRDKYPDVVLYMKNRGVLRESVKKWRIGYAPPGWRNLYERLIGSFTEKELLDVGLIKFPDEGGEKKPYDRFRDRIMFPLFDEKGRVVAFSGRVFHEEEGSAKYLNSPETPIFRKSRVLYGYDKAKGAIRKFNFAVMVEGQFDLVMAHQGGFPNSVALSGTALSDDHLALLSRMSKNLLLALDADPAGIASVGRGARLALSEGFDVKVALLPQGLDPADLVKRDPLEFKKAVREGKHIVDFFLATLSSSLKDPRTLRREVERIVLPYVRDIRSRIDQAHFVGVIAHAIGVSPEAVREELLREEESHEKVHPREEEEARAGTRRETIERKIAEILLPHAGEPDFQGFFKRCENISGDPHYLERYGGEEVRGEEDGTDGADKDAMIKQLEELLLRYEEEVVREDLAMIAGQLKEAERQRDEAFTQGLLLRSRELGKKLVRLQALR